MQSGETERRRFGCQRLDKVWYAGRVRVENLERIAAGVRTEGPGEGQFVTDHLGLMADVVVDAEPS